MRERLARKGLSRVLRWVFGIVGSAFLLVAVLETWDRSQGFPLPSLWPFVWAWLLIIVGLVSLAQGWARLLSGTSARGLTAGFYTSQVGRYIPGGVWQAIAQVGLAKGAGATLPQASTAFVVHALIQAAAGGTIGATLAAFGTGRPLGLRLVALAGLLPLALLHRGTIRSAAGVLSRLFRRTFPEAMIPSQRAILVSYFLTMATLVANGVAFWVLLSSVDGYPELSVVVPAFALSWTLGFVAVPFPSGIGVREAALILAVGTAPGTTPLIAASMSHRLVVIAGEVLMIGWSALWTTKRPPTEADAVR